MEIETERLRLTLLTPEHLALWLSDIPKLEEHLKCTYCGEPVEGLFRKIVTGQREAALKDRRNYMWHSFWFIIRKADRTVVGSAGFKNTPDDRGEVEIGYGLGKGFEHCGYMTETVRAMCGWAFGQNGVKHITAETELGGLASQRVLKNCGFQEYQRGQTVWWRL